MRVVRFYLDRTCEIECCFLGALGLEQQTAGVKCEVEIIGRELTGSNRAGNRRIAIAARRKRAAQVAITFYPIGMLIEHPGIGFRRFGMKPAIAEKPSTAMRHCQIIAGKRERPTSIFNGGLAAIFVKRALGKAAVKPRSFRSVSVIFPRREQRRIDRATVHGADEGRTIDR